VNFACVVLTEGCLLKTGNWTMRDTTAQAFAISRPTPGGASPCPIGQLSQGKEVTECRKRKR
jgi:hypothetical protein